MKSVVMAICKFDHVSENALLIRGIKVLHSLKLYYQGQGDMCGVE